MPKQVNKDEFNKAIEDHKTVMVDFFATWCGPCQMMAPVLDDLAKDFKDDKDIAIIKVDIDETPEIPASYNVMGVPTFLVIKDGKEAARQVGATTKEILKEKLLGK